MRSKKNYTGCTLDVLTEKNKLAVASERKITYITALLSGTNAETKLECDAKK